MRATIELVEQAVLLPHVALGQNRSGVFSADGQAVEAALHRRGKNHVFNSPEYSEAMPTKRLDVALYGGFSFAPHFGHQVVESTARLWAARYLPEGLPVLFLPSWVSTRGLSPYFRDLANCLGVTAPLYLVQEPTSVNTLFVPAQLFGLGEYIGAHSEFIRFAREMRARVPRHALNRDRVYVSRSELPRSQGRLISERLLEDNLERQGYRVVHPETLSIEAQLALYVTAGELLFAEGSPINLYAMVASAGQKVGIVARRFSVSPFLEQIQRFSKLRAKAFLHVVGLLAPPRDGYPAAFAASLIDFRQLGESLRREGFINDDTEWRCPSRDALMAEIEAIAGQYDGLARWIASVADIRNLPQPGDWAERCFRAVAELTT